MIGLITVGSSALFAGAAIGMGVAALDARDQWVDSKYTDTDAHGVASGLRIGTNVAWATAGTAAVVGLLLWLTAPKPAERSPARPSVTTGGALRGAF